MRPQYLIAVQNLKKARDAAVMGEKVAAARDFKNVVLLLGLLPPERTRDILLAHAHLGYYQTVTRESQGREDKVALESLHLGISYARSTRDPLARAIAEECLSGLDVAL